MFEIDHPATQQWKRELLRAAQIPIPPSVTFVPVDFETESLAARLEACGFCPAPAFFSWLGVTPYLSRPAFEETIRFIARVPEASGVAFDYVILPSLMDITQRFFHGLVTRRVAKAGEPFQLWLIRRNWPTNSERLGSRTSKIWTPQRPMPGTLRTAPMVCASKAAPCTC